MTDSLAASTVLYLWVAEHIGALLGEFCPQVLKPSADLNLDELLRHNGDDMNGAITMTGIGAAVSDRCPRKDLDQGSDDLILFENIGDNDATTRDVLYLTEANAFDDRW